MVIYFPERAHLFPGKVLDTAPKLVARFSVIIFVYFRLPFFLLCHCSQSHSSSIVLKPKIFENEHQEMLPLQTFSEQRYGSIRSIR